jgi:hypothetical protein
MQKKELEEQACAREQLLQKINIKTNGRFIDFCTENFLCPECFSDLQERDEELVCTTCGFVVNSLNPEASIPFDEPKTPVNALAFGHGEGGTLGMRGTFCVLARANGVVDLPIRARHISIITLKVDNPKIMSMLRHGRVLAHEWGFDEHGKLKSIIFSNSMGRLIRKVGAYIVLSEWHIPLKQVVNACFALCLKRLLGEKTFQEAVQKLKVDQNMLVSVDILGSLARDNNYGKILGSLQATKTGNQIIYPFRSCACATCPKKIECYW